MYPFAQNRASPEFAPGIPNSNGRPDRIVVVILQPHLPALSNDPVIVISILVQAERLTSEESDNLPPSALRESLGCKAREWLNLPGTSDPLPERVP